ncbi:MAG: NADP-dependent oxidoreductase [Solirubrobacteraceae bacterium]
MRAAVIDRFGPPDVLKIKTQPIPTPGAHQLLVRIIAAGVNPVDAQNRRDGSWAGITPPATLGSDAAGLVSAVGSKVTDFEVGDDVYYFSDFLGGGDGTYAEYQAVDAHIVSRRPTRLSFVDAAAVPLAAGTAYELIVRRLALNRGQRVLIVGAGGGVGLYAVQLARAAGTNIVAVARKSKHDALRELGVEVVLDYRDSDLWHQIGRAGPIHAVVDLAGGDVAVRGVDILAEAGALASVSTLSGDFELAVDKNLTLHGVLVRPDANRLRQLTSLVDQGALRPIISEEFALTDIASAHRQIETGHTFGKLVVRLQP